MSATPTVKTSILRMVAAHFPSLVYGFPRTYIVASVRGDKRLDLVPPPDATHLPELRAVEQWIVGGALVTPTVGSQVTVTFRDADRRRPIVVAFAPGSVPPRVSWDADEVVLSHLSEIVAAGLETGRVVRWGDPITVPVVGSVATGPIAPSDPIVNSVSRVHA